MSPRRLVAPLRHITWPQVGIILGALALVAFLGALMLAKDHSDRKDDTVSAQLAELHDQLASSQKAREALAADRHRWQAQITASIEQLREAGQQPIIVAPDAVAAPLTAPVVTTTTTTPPPVIVLTPPPTTTTTATTTTTEPPPETTTTTEPETTTTTETTEEPTP